MTINEEGTVPVEQQVHDRPDDPGAGEYMAELAASAISRRA